MKTHLIKDTGEVLLVSKPEELKEMQTLVRGPIEIVNAPMPKASRPPEGLDRSEGDDMQ